MDCHEEFQHSQTTPEQERGLKWKMTDEKSMK